MATRSSSVSMSPACTAQHMGGKDCHGRVEESHIKIRAMGCPPERGEGRTVVTRV